MKRVKYYAFMLIMFMFAILNVNAESSDFQPILNMETDITENQIQMILGFTGEEVMIVDHTLSYDNTKLKLNEVKALDNFNVEVTDEVKDGKWSTLTILADSDYSFNDSNYAVVVFDVLSAYKKGKSADIFVYNVNAVGPSKQKYRNVGQILKVKRESVNEISYSAVEITKNTKMEYWFKANYLFFVLGGVLIIGIIVLILVLPSKRKKEARDQDVGSNIKSENYDPNGNFKIDQNEIDSIGRVDKPIDMSQAIIVNENVKPFGEIVGKFDNDPKTEVTPTQSNLQNVNQVNVFNATSENVGTTIDPFNMSVESPKETTVSLENDGIKEIDENKNDGLIQISSNILEEAKVEDVNNVPIFDVVIPNQTSGVASVVNPVSQVKEAPVTGTSLEDLAQAQAPVNVSANQLVQTIQENRTVIANNVDTSDMLVVKGDVNALPSAPTVNTNHNVMSSLSDDANSDEGDAQINNHINILIILLGIVSLLTFSNVNAEEYNVTSLRECLIGKIECNDSLDYNGDGNYDILDLLATKDTTDCNFEKKMKQDPGFQALHAQSNNIMSESQKTTTTKKAGIVTKKTTTKKTKTTTTKKSTTANGTTTKKSTTARSTTTKKSTTAKSTTTKKTTTKKSTTARSTTTKKTTTKKSTTSKTTAPTYTFTITSNNATPDRSSVQIKSGNSTFINFTPQTGYKYQSVTCTGVSSSFNPTSNKLTLTKPTADGSCNVTYAVRSDMQVKGSVVYHYNNGTTKSTKSVTLKGGFNTSQSVSVDGTGYTLTGISCTNNVSGSWSNNTFSAKLTNDSICQINFNANLYTLNVYDSNNNNTNVYSSTIEYDTTVPLVITVLSDSKRSKLKCNGKTVTINGTEIGTNTYQYSFRYTGGVTNECYLS